MRLVLLCILLASEFAFSDAFLVSLSPSRAHATALSLNRIAPSRRESLRWVIQSVQRSKTEIDMDPHLLNALALLLQARTQAQVSDAGRLLQQATIPDSPEIKERLIKAASLAGLLDMAQNIMDDLMASNHSISSIAYVAYLQGLRQRGRLERMEITLDQLAAQLHEPMNVLALNSYLAAMLDEPAKDARAVLENSHTRWKIHPDAASFATVMNASPRSVVDQLWTSMLRLSIEPTLYCYHARIKVASDEEALDILKEIQSTLEPDRYTIDLVIVPLARAGKIPEIIALLDRYVEQERNPQVLHTAFAAFLTTLCKAEKMACAQIVFDKFLSYSASSTLHYNIMISGYKHLFDDDAEQGIRGKAIELYKKMIRSGLRPDGYTLTSMTGFVLDSKELTELVRVGIIECDVDVTHAVLRAILSAYGNVGDMSSACWMFDKFPNGDVSTWNVLMGTFAKSGNGDTVIRVASSEAARVLERELMVVGTGNSTLSPRDRKFTLASYLDSLTAPTAARVLLELMGGHILVKGIGIRVPRPNSQSYALAAKALQYGPCDVSVAMELFQNATQSGVLIDGRFINGVFRLFGDDINRALAAWKNTIRAACVTDKRALDSTLIASYHGLLFVAGRALRPDIALRIVYAMQKENVTADETALNCYLAGKRKVVELTPTNNVFGKITPIGEGLRFTTQFESLLSVECLKFDVKDNRRRGEQRVRIIM